jgi:predicted cobalt transporter CbtA
MKHKLMVIVVGLVMMLSPALLLSPVISAETTGHDAAAPAPSDNKAAVCAGVALTGSPCPADSSADTTGVAKTVATVINIMSIVIGFAAVIMIMVGGFKYIISSGDSANINSAKNTILYALIGLVVVALAQVIVHFVLSKVG